MLSFPETRADDVAWKWEGACRDLQYDPDLWSSPYMDDLGQAVWVCQNVCPVRADCWLWASRNREQVDMMVYGGDYWTRGRIADGWRNNGPVRVARRQPVPRPPSGLPARTERAVVTVRASYDIDLIRACLVAGMSNSQIATRLGQPEHGLRLFIGRHKLRAEVKS